MQFNSKVTQLLPVLLDERARAILVALAAGKDTRRNLSRRCGISLPATREGLCLLMHYGIVTLRRTGGKAVYGIDRAFVSALMNGGSHELEWEEETSGLDNVFLLPTERSHGSEWLPRGEKHDSWTSTSIGTAV